MWANSPLPPLSTPAWVCECIRPPTHTRTDSQLIRTRQQGTWMAGPVVQSGSSFRTIFIRSSRSNHTPTRLRIMTNRETNEADDCEWQVDWMFWRESGCFGGNLDIGGNYVDWLVSLIISSALVSNCSPSGCEMITDELFVFSFNWQRYFVECAFNCSVASSLTLYLTLGYLFFFYLWKMGWCKKRKTFDIC